jgi:hypothetical protein
MLAYVRRTASHYLTPIFQRRNFIIMGFIYKIMSSSKCEIKLREILSKFNLNKTKKGSNDVSVASCLLVKIVFSEEDKAAIKFLTENKHHGAQHFLTEFPAKHWSLSGLKRI